MIPLSSPQYYLGSWTGNATDDDGVDWIVTSEDGWSSSPAIRPVQEDKSVGDGMWGGPGFYGARVVSLAGKAIANDRLAMLNAKERLKAAVGPREKARLLVAEAHMSRYCWVRLTDQIQITDLGAQAFDWTLTLTAADPRRYAADPVTASTGLASGIMTGRTYPRTYPLTYNYVEGSGGSVYFTQSGDFDETPAQIVIWGPVVDPQVAHVQTGRSLRFGLTLAAGETLEVDLAARTALLNGTASRAATLSGESAWFMLRPGLNELQFRGTDPDLGSRPLMSVTASSAWT